MKNGLFSLLALALLVSCSSSLPPTGSAVSYSNIDSRSLNTDSTTLAIIKPYKHLHDSLMAQPLGYLAERFEKKGYANLLWNFSADVLFQSAEEIFGQKADAAFINGSGLRVPYLAAGPLTRSNIFELMPFENYVMMVKMNGHQLQMLANHVVRRGGDPVAGMNITGKKGGNQAEVIVIGGRVADTTTIYNVITLDFAALYAGIKAFENPQERVESKMLFRDVIEKYVKTQQRMGKMISANADARVILY